MVRKTLVGSVDELPLRVPNAVFSVSYKYPFKKVELRKAENFKEHMTVLNTLNFQRTVKVKV